MNVDVEEAGRDDQARGIELRNIGNVRLADGGNLSITDDHVDDGIDPARRVDKPPTLDHQIHYTPTIRYRIAMRTATPEATWSRMTENGPSATSDVISTPRLMGPGCMMMASGFALVARSRLNP